MSLNKSYPIILLSTKTMGNCESTNSHIQSSIPDQGQLTIQNVLRPIFPILAGPEPTTISTSTRPSTLVTSNASSQHKNQTIVEPPIASSNHLAVQEQQMAHADPSSGGISSLSSGGVGDLVSSGRGASQGSYPSKEISQQLDQTLFEEDVHEQNPNQYSKLPFGKLQFTME